MSDVLELFHPLIERWFSGRFPRPTRCQALAWPRIAKREHVLVTAPTGSGKTLLAFLYALDSLAKGLWTAGRLHVVYVTPLKALGNDIQRNLLEPLAEIRALFEKEGLELPIVRVATRSGDTQESERRRLWRDPPQILITTPESLGILLNHGRAGTLFCETKTAIVDEVHSLAESKRGTLLAAALERLGLIAGEFQRIGLSATVSPLETIASWLGGATLCESGALRPRDVAIVDTAERKRYDLEVHFVPRASPESEDANGRSSEGVWRALADQIRGRIETASKAIAFANSRRTVETVARLINEGKKEPLVYAHHGSLSREIREVVEERLKQGALRGVVATSSLELGIDVGAIDEVLLVQTPLSCSQAAQRIGRAGHSVGEVSRAVLYATHGRDVLEAAVVARAVLDGEIEPIAPPVAPLDVLAQVILAVAAEVEWKADDLYAFVRRAAPYAELSRREFDLVIEMLAGRYDGMRLHELRARIAFDRIAGTVRALQGTRRLLNTQGGAIPERGSFALRLADDRSAIGQLDEEFVWERRVGEVFTLGVQAWRIERITASDVLVSPSRHNTAATPFWRSEEQGHGLWFAERLGRFLAKADLKLEDPAFAGELEERHCLNREACNALISHLAAQKQATKASLPHLDHVVLEHVQSGSSPGRFLDIIHTNWGLRLNRPFALALVSAIASRTGQRPGAAQDNECIVLDLVEPLAAAELMRLVDPGDLLRQVASALAETGYFGAHFRENAGRAMLLPRLGQGRRTPLWLLRQRAKELHDAMSKRPDFPLLLETWKTAAQAGMELDALASRLEKLRAGELRLSEAYTERPSPFALSAIRRRTHSLMYEDDVPPLPPMGGLLAEVAASSRLRPKIKGSIARLFTCKLQRLEEGYAPASSMELLEWLKERVFIPADEWRVLITAASRDSGIAESALREELRARAIARADDSGDALFVVAIERAHELLDALGDSRCTSWRGLDLDRTDPPAEAFSALEIAARLSRHDAADPEERLAALLGEWLRTEGPVASDVIAAHLGISAERVLASLSLLAADGQVVQGEITEEAERIEVCDAANLARLLGFLRRSQHPALEPLLPTALPLWLASHQGLCGADGEAELPRVIEQLLGQSAPAELWEQEIFPARLLGYRQAWLDKLFAETDLGWYGGKAKHLSFAFDDDRPLFSSPLERGEQDSGAASLLPATGRCTVTDLALAAPHRTELAVTEELFRLAWQGLATCDSFAVVRWGNASFFSGPPPPLGIARKNRFGKSRPRLGSWRSLPPIAPPDDPLDHEELNKDRARLLLGRYGVVFRELLAREPLCWQWRDISRSLRLLELAGEAVGGCFFRGIAGLQFALPSAVESLRQGLDDRRIFWLSAADPASAAGLGVNGLDLPRRIASTHLAFRGSALAVISTRSCRVLEIRLAPSDPDLPPCLGFLSNLLTRDARPAAAVSVEQINGECAAQSPYRAVLALLGAVEVDPKALILRRRY